MKFERGTQVQHRESPNWKAVVVRDTNPRKPVNGFVLVNHNGRESLMPKSTVRVSFHLDAKKEFGEFDNNELNKSIQTMTLSFSEIIVTF